MFALQLINIGNGGLNKVRNRIHRDFHCAWRYGATIGRFAAYAADYLICHGQATFHPLQIRHVCRTLFHNALPRLSLDCHSQAAFQAAKSAFYGKIWLDLKIGRATRADCKQSAKPFFFPNPNGLDGLFHALLPDFGNGDAS